MQSFGQQFADNHVVVGTDCPDVGHILLAIHRTGKVVEIFHRSLHRFFNTPPNRHRITAGNNITEAFFKNSAGQHRGSRCPIASQIRGFAGHFVDQLGSHILKRVLQFDFLADGYPILGNCWAAKRLVNNNVFSSWTHRDCNGIRQLFDTLEHLCAGLIFKHQLLSCHGNSSLFCNR